MAVVVRDGGRPPERRWALFNTFYLVMKKRESLKNFQNPKIAKLLREEDRLLRSVHTRLGFVLHARAERSDGAQTMLNRAEFEQLVREVVVELGDDDSQQAVASVMEATTERLVLVSTPESGEYVRFDIRQLQEFFAGEFIYDGASPDEIGRRIEVIGEDAHWREVMHFLMSALIENRRATELAVAVQVLRRLNEGDESRKDQLFCRRVIPASLLAGRLLLEGVVEQDQRDRQQLKPLLDPIGGIVDLDLIRPFGSLTMGRSRQWFVQLLLDKVEMSNPREHVGALFLLGWLLPDDHGATSDVRLAFLNLPDDLKAQVFDSWAGSIIVHRYAVRAELVSAPFASWVFLEALRFLTTSGWLAHDADIVRKAVDILRSNRGTFIECLRASGMKKGIAEGFWRLFEESPRARYATELSIDLGIVRGSTFPANWKNRKKVASFSAGSVKNSFSSSQGYFRLLLSFIWFSEEITDSSLAELRAQLRQATTRRLGAVPDALRALVPIEDDYAVDPYGFDHFADLPAEELIKRMKHWKETGRYMAYSELRLLTGDQVTDQSWRVATQVMPRLAVRFAFAPEYCRLPAGSTSQFVQEMRALFESRPDLPAQYILQWGLLQDDLPELLALLKDKAKDVEACENGWIEVSTSPRPFHVQLPDEADVLYVLAQAVTAWATNESEMLMPNLSLSKKESVSSLLNAMDLSAERLRGVARDDSLSRRARAGAAALFWLQHKEAIKKSEPRLAIAVELHTYVELVEPHSAEWMTRAFVGGVLAPMSSLDPGARAAVTYLLEKSTQTSSVHSAVLDLLRQWRESSVAPVSSRQVMQDWLAYSFSAPH